MRSRNNWQNITRIYLTQLSRTLHFLKQKSGQLKTTTWVIKIGLVTFITFTFQFNNEVKKNNKSRNQYPKFKAICFQYCTYYVISTTFITFAKRNCCNMIFFLYSNVMIYVQFIVMITTKSKKNIMRLL